MDESWAVLAEASELARDGEPFALATVVWRQGPSSSRQGSRAIITAGGDLRGWIGGACAEPTVIREARQVISSGQPRLLLLGSPAQIADTEQPGGTEQAGGTGQPGGTEQAGGTGQPGGTGRFGRRVVEGMTVVPIACQSEGALEIYIEPVLPVPHLVVVGRSPMAQTLTELASALGWRAELIDGDEFRTGAASERSMVVVATQGHSDETVVERAAAARPAYLGLVGSHRRGAAVLGYLADRGVPQEQLDQVRVPAGLDLGSTTHVEIAVAILAELVQLRASGALAVRAAGPSAGAADRSQTAAVGGAEGHASHQPAQPGHVGGGHPSPRPAQPESATDPVCGMTVTAGPGGLPAEHDGVTYYFCCAGCRQAFDKDPAAYVKRETRC